MEGSVALVFLGTDGEVYPVVGTPGSGPLPVSGESIVTVPPGGLQVTAPPPGLLVTGAAGGLEVSAPPGGLPVAAPAGGLPVAAPAGGLPVAAPAGGLEVSAPPGGLLMAAPAGGLEVSSPPGGLMVQGIQPAGSPAAGINPVLIAGQSGANTQPLLTDTSGVLLTSPEGHRATYAASINASAVPISQFLQIMQLMGSPSKLVKVWHVDVSATSATYGANNNVLLQKTIAPVAGGTVATPNALDSINPAATASLTSFTGGAATAGGAVNISSTFWAIGSPTQIGTTFTWQATAGVQPLVLRGVNQGCIIVVNVGEANAIIAVNIVFTEE